MTQINGVTTHAVLEVSLVMLVKTDEVTVVVSVGCGFGTSVIGIRVEFVSFRIVVVSGAFDESGGVDTVIDVADVVDVEDEVVLVVLTGSGPVNVVKVVLTMVTVAVLLDVELELVVVLLPV